jgi:hypothetical protein
MIVVEGPSPEDAPAITREDVDAFFNALFPPEPAPEPASTREEIDAAFESLFPSESVTTPLPVLVTEPASEPAPKPVIICKERVSPQAYDDGTIWWRTCNFNPLDECQEAQIKGLLDEGEYYSLTI